MRTARPARAPAASPRSRPGCWGRSGTGRPRVRPATRRTGRAHGPGVHVLPDLPGDRAAARGPARGRRAPGRRAGLAVGGARVPARERARGGAAAARRAGAAHRRHRRRRRPRRPEWPDPSSPSREDRPLERWAEARERRRAERRSERSAEPLRPLSYVLQRPTIGIDIGGTKVAGGVVDVDGRILERGRRETPDRSKSPAGRRGHDRRPGRRAGQPPRHRRRRHRRRGVRGRGPGHGALRPAPVLAQRAAARRHPSAAPAAGRRRERRQRRAVGRVAVRRGPGRGQPGLRQPRHRHRRQPS